MLNGDGILIEFLNEDIENIHISNIENEILKLDIVFDFSEKSKYDKKLIIVNHSLEEYDRLIKSEFNMNDVVLIKNYVPSYKSERTVFGPNEIKSIFKKGLQIFALELDVRIQNSVYLGVMESFDCNRDLVENKVTLRRQLLSVYSELVKGNT